MWNYGTYKNIRQVFFAAEIIPEDGYPELLLRQKEYMEENPQKYTEFAADIHVVNQLIDNEQKTMIAKKWFYNAFSEEVQNGLYPKDLGYYVGLKISEIFLEEEIQTKPRDMVLQQLLKIEIPLNRIEKILHTLATS